MVAHRFSCGAIAALLLFLTLFCCSVPLIAPPSSINDLVTTNHTLGSTSDGQARPAEPFVGESLEEVIRLAEEILERLDRELIDYTADLVKRERVNGVLGGESRMTLKIRNRDAQGSDSLAAYITFSSPAFAKGREVIWAESENEGKIIAHEGGFKNWTRLTLDPNGTLAMMGNKYPITEIGLVKLVEKLVEKGKRDQELAEAEVSVSSGHMVGDRECHLIEVRHPKQKEGLDFHLAQIFLDQERMIPLRYAAYLWPDSGEDPPLEEEYTYLNVQLNVGLPVETFDPDNPNYEFP